LSPDIVGKGKVMNRWIQSGKIIVGSHATSSWWCHCFHCISAVKILLDNDFETALKLQVLHF